MLELTAEFGKLPKLLSSLRSAQREMIKHRITSIVRTGQCGNVN